MTNELKPDNPTCDDCEHKIGEECGFDGHEIDWDTEACDKFKWLGIYDIY